LAAENAKAEVELTRLAQIKAQKEAAQKEADLEA